MNGTSSSPPTSCSDAIRAAGLSVTDLTGVAYSPLRDAWSLSPDMAVNYMLLAARV